MLSRLTKQSLKHDQNFGFDAMDGWTKSCTKSLLKLNCFFDMIFEGFWPENGMILVSIWDLINFSATQRRHFRTLASPRISLGASLSVQGRPKLAKMRPKTAPKWLKSGQKCAKCRHKTTWKRPIVKHKQFSVTCETWNSCVLNIKLQFSLTSVHEKCKRVNKNLFATSRSGNLKNKFWLKHFFFQHYISVIRVRCKIIACCHNITYWYFTIMLYYLRVLGYSNPVQSFTWRL